MTSHHSMLTVMFLGLTGALACSTDERYSERKEVQSMDTSLSTAIASLNPNDDKKVNALVEAIRSKAWDQPRQIVEMANTWESDEQPERNARLVLLSLGDIVLTPLLDSLRSDSAEKLVWSLQTAVGVQRENQARIVKQLNQLLADKRQLPVPVQSPSTEEKVPERRVCDESYLLLRRLLAMEDEESDMVNARIFLYSMTEEERDREIARLMGSKKWEALTEQAEAMPETKERK